MQSSITFVEQFGVNGYLNGYAEYKTLVDNKMSKDSRVNRYGGMQGTEKRLINTEWSVFNLLNAKASQL